MARFLRKWKSRGVGEEVVSSLDIAFVLGGGVDTTYGMS
jgi:hypothetical protein